MGDMDAAMTNWIWMIVLDLVLAGTIFGVYLHWPRRLVNLHRAKEPYWLSVVSGHPEVLPRLFIMKYGPWPQPKAINFSAFTPVRISPGKPVIFRGRPNHVRYWGFVFYPAGVHQHGTSLPAIYSPEISLDDNGTYEVVFSASRTGRNWVDTGCARAGIISMRNYYPRRPSRIRMPAIYYGDELVLPLKEYPYEA